LTASDHKGLVLSWTLWLGYAAAWSTALLTPYPIQARDAVLPDEYHFIASKGLHVAAYALFAVLTSFLQVSIRWRRIVLVCVILHAPASEFLQQFVGRTPALMDVGLDLTGIALGVCITWKRWRAS
jgi:VanZ family protein